ncbi:hypothetical protein RUE5091_04550 [Ruegeria denitrificans]|uniref:Uncharacterized protein n=1 Tax=Ruegeria denitrificans TaxID=1715692 RepID=A0A0P1IL14_9RHOB|nr:antitoxin Xre/MbcA/ParS toxin-binding domain-containing protein [Ruegeria denitrificans]CUK20718.1 hypothetical protein RUE5091_04550 [Ruegeria denitrificans]
MTAGNDLGGLIRFITRDEVWHERLADVLDEHFLPSLEAFDLDFEDLSDLLGEDWPTVLWGGGLEDLLGRTFAPGNENAVDAYLKRHGSKESTQTRAYIEGLRYAPVSLYEVSKIVAGKSMVLRDLLSDTKPVTVREHSATQMLQQWDRIAARVVPHGDHNVISGALLPFDPEAVAMFEDGLRTVLKLNAQDELRLTQDQLQRSAPLFTNAWLFAHLPNLLDPEPPQISNSDGDDLVFHELRFPLATGVTHSQVSQRLSQSTELVISGQKDWTWLAVDNPSSNKRGTGLVLDRSMSGTSVLGSLNLKGKTLTLSVNSATRAERGEALVRDLLGDLVKSPLTSIQTVGQMMADDSQESGVAEEEDIPPDLARQMAHEHLEQHYRDTLDQPIPALGGKTPRQAVRSTAGRKQVIDWLKTIENRSARQTGSPVADYDFSWMWHELGLSDYRK